MWFAWVGTKLLRQMGEVSLPAHLKDVVTIVTGLSDLPAYQRYVCGHQLSEGEHRRTYWTPMLDGVCDRPKHTRRVRVTNGTVTEAPVGAASDGYVIPWSLFSMYNIPFGLQVTNQASNQVGCRHCCCSPHGASPVCFAGLLGGREGELSSPHDEPGGVGLVGD